MAYSKAEEFNEQDIVLAKYAKALSHPARVAILKILAKQESCYCGDIVNELPIAQATVSQHLKELKNAGLIEGEITPPKVRYCIDSKNFAQAREYFKALFE
ncbi:metalloregulator ArsR/SmtB family transcription factor [uncultured Coprobacter sp.]|uniref:ArsR/SmtB family transcription factor n=1 Tax=uncultured Coprobacter sp. TaxID=1720550 RepID=UPI002597644F|nr:metalloregulator ArsR/SmtB family transcription factor [uncultured Coprobacter sp.]